MNNKKFKIGKNVEGILRKEGNGYTKLDQQINSPIYVDIMIDDLLPDAIISLIIYEF